MRGTAFSGVIENKFMYIGQQWSTINVWPRKRIPSRHANLESYMGTTAVSRGTNDGLNRCSNSWFCFEISSLIMYYSYRKRYPPNQSTTQHPKIV